MRKPVRARRTEFQYNIIGADSAYETVYSYKYDSKGNVYSVEDHRNSRMTVYAYDHENKPIRTYEYDTETYYYLLGTDVGYDNEDRVSYISFAFDYTYSTTGTDVGVMSYGYSYDDNGNINIMDIDGLVDNNFFDGYVNPEYDKFGRVSSKAIGFDLNIPNYVHQVQTNNQTHTSHDVANKSTRYPIPYSQER